MVISFSEKIHHDNFIVTTSIPFFFSQTDRSFSPFSYREIVQLQNWNSRERLEISSGDLRSKIGKEAFP